MSGGSEVWINASDWRRAAAVAREQNIRRESGAEDGEGPGAGAGEGGRRFYARRTSRRARSQCRLARGTSPAEGRKEGGCARIGAGRARRSGPGRQKSGPSVHVVEARASMKACAVHSPERSQVRSKSTSGPGPLSLQPDYVDLLAV